MFNEKQTPGTIKGTGEILLDYGRKLLYQFEIVELGGNEKVKEEEPIYMKDLFYDQTTGECTGFKMVRLDRESLE